jgi:hypothetical protein
LRIPLERRVAVDVALVRRGVVGEDFRIRRVLAPAHRPARHVARDPAQPRGEGSSHRVVLVGLGDEVHEGLLGHIRRVRRAAGIEHREAVDGIPMPPIELGEGIFVTLLHAREQGKLGLQVLGGHRHGVLSTRIADAGPERFQIGD